MAAVPERDDELLSDEGVDKEADVAAERRRVLEALGLTLVKSRTEAIADRANSGIEDEWLEDEEFYEGIDDANRGEMKAWRSKPLGQAALPDTSATQSTVFFNITRPYVDMAAARMGDMLLPNDDRGWAIKPTPVPELVAIAEGKIPPHIVDQIENAPEFAKLPADQRQARIDKTKGDLVAQEDAKLEEAKEKARRAEKRIDDWHVECQYHAQTRLTIKDCAKLGSGVLKGPIPIPKTTVAYKNGKLIVERTTKPASVCIDPWNFYPAPGCGENIHNGTHCWERDDITPKRLSALKQAPGYLEEEIDIVLKEGPHKATKAIAEGPASTIGLVQRDTKSLFEIWYYHGQVTREELESAGCEDCGDEDIYNAVITMVNNHIIKASLNHIDTGEFPYDVMVWQTRKGSPFGIGVARQVRTPQRVVLGASRNMMDNAGMAGGPMLAYLAGLLEPADGVAEIVPRKVWIAGEDADVEDIDKAIRFIQMPMMQVELEAIINLGLRMAEQVTGMPLIMQGQTTQTTPDTLGGMEMLNNNAGAPLRAVAKLFDDRVTEPHVRRYYAYLLQYGDDKEKGDFQVDARGSSALVERDLNNQAIAQAFPMVGNPVFDIDPQKYSKEWLKSRHLDPRRFEFDDDKWKKIVEQLSQPKSDSSVEVAQIRAQADAQKQAKDIEFKVAMEAMAEQRNKEDRNMVVALEAVSQQLEGAKLQSGDRQAVDKIKAELAKVVMQLNTQLKLAQAKNVQGAEQVATPPTEPPGRAPAGQAFQR